MMFLDEDELQQLTGRVRKPAQIKALNEMGIEHKKRADGRAAVLHSHVNKVLGGALPTTLKGKHNQPDFSSLGR